MAKTLYIVISDCGDGSSSLEMTFDKEVIDLLNQQQDDDELDDCYQSGDGLQVTELTVPDECTYKSLGVYFPLTKEDILEDM